MDELRRPIRQSFEKAGSSSEAPRLLARIGRVAGRPAILAGLIAFVAIPLTECSSEERIDGFTSAEWSVLHTLSPLPEVAPPDPTNQWADDPDAAHFGQRIFFEKRHSGGLQVESDLGELGETQLVGCITCHIPTAQFDDHRPVNNVSAGFQYTLRNTPSLINVAFYDFHGWGGKQDSLWTQASLSPESSENAGGDRCLYTRIMWDHHRDQYESVFGPMPEEYGLDESDPDHIPALCHPSRESETWNDTMSQAARDAVNEVLANCGKAIAAYERLLISGNSPFDQYVAGDFGALNASQKRGLRLFIGKAACVTCHSGPAFTDNDYHNLGVPQIGQSSPNDDSRYPLPEEDQGRYVDITAVLNHQFNSASQWSDDQAHGQMRQAELMPEEVHRGAFRTKGLRGVALTAPYFHTGHVETLREVMEFYNDGGDTEGFVGTKSGLMRPLNLTSQEMDDLVAFMQALTGDPIPEHLTINLMEAD